MKQFTIKTSRRTHFVLISDEVQRIVTALGIREGVCIVFIPHTTPCIALLPSEHKGSPA
jgi:thiamine phosphate synthase YjbQ (UPF0047 family)